MIHSHPYPRGRLILAQTLSTLLLGACARGPGSTRPQKDLPEIPFSSFEVEELVFRTAREAGLSSHRSALRIDLADGNAKNIGVMLKFDRCTSEENQALCEKSYLDLLEHYEVLNQNRFATHVIEEIYHMTEVAIEDIVLVVDVGCREYRYQVDGADHVKVTEDGTKCRHKDHHAIIAEIALADQAPESRDPLEWARDQLRDEIPPRLFPNTEAEPQATGGRYDSKTKICFAPDYPGFYPGEWRSIVYTISLSSVGESRDGEKLVQLKVYVSGYKEHAAGCKGERVAMSEEHEEAIAKNIVTHGSEIICGGAPSDCIRTD